jgi:hypothetical protein
VRAAGKATRSTPTPAANTAPPGLAAGRVRPEDRGLVLGAPDTGAATMPGPPGPIGARRVLLREYRRSTPASSRRRTAGWLPASEWCGCTRTEHLAQRQPRRPRRWHGSSRGTSDHERVNEEVSSGIPGEGCKRGSLCAPGRTDGTFASGPALRVQVLWWQGVRVREGRRRMRRPRMRRIGQGRSRSGTCPYTST